MYLFVEFDNDNVLDLDFKVDILFTCQRIVFCLEYK